MGFDITSYWTLLYFLLYFVLPGNQVAKCDVFKRSRNIIRDSYGLTKPYNLLVVSGIIKCLSYVFLGKQNVV